MSGGQEDFGPLMDVLLTCVGVMDVVSLFALAINSPPSKSTSSMSKKKLSATDINNNDVIGLMRDKSPISDTRSASKSIPMLVVDSLIKEDDVIDSLLSKVNELEAKVSELEIRSRESSMERFLDSERYRRSRSPSPYAHPIDAENEGEGEDVGDGALDENVISHTTKLITRDDEFRKTIRRSSKESSSHETREEELAKLTEIETEEMNNMNDFIPIRYSQHDDNNEQHQHNDDDFNSHSGVSIDTIEEITTCPIHGDMGEENIDEQKQISEKQQPDAAQQIDINENFIKMEREVLKQQQPRASPSKMLIKQAHVESSDFPDETTSDLEVVVDEDIIKPNMLIEREKDRVKISPSPVIENFPKINTFSSDTTEETLAISPIEHSAAKLVENEPLNQPSIVPENIFIKSPVNIEHSKEVEEDIFTENTSEMPNEKVPIAVQIMDDTPTTSSNKEENLNLNDASSLMKEEGDRNLSGTSQHQQASAVLENVEYLNFTHLSSSRLTYVLILLF